MCVDHDADLPALPAGTHTAAAERLVLTAADGNRFNAVVATPETPTGQPGVLVLPDIRGLFRFYEDLACRFARHGYPALAMDYFGRTAGTEPRDADFAFMEHVGQTTSAGMNADIAAAVGHLGAAAGEAPLYSVGFCFGGNMSWAASTHGHGLAGVIGFYGKPEADRPAGDGPIWDRCGLIDGRLLALFGGADPGIPPENVSRFTAALEVAGTDHEVVTYPDAPHSFFDRSQGDFATESTDAWNRMISFMAA